MPVAPGIPEMKISELPTVKKPEVWEFSAHPHATIRAKGRQHIDLRLGNPSTGIAHSFVLPKARVPDPGEMVQVIPTVDHTVPYMDFVGDLPPGYGHGTVTKGRRTKAEVYHADPGDEAGTKLRFNLYDEASPEEFSVRKDGQGRFFLHNKTQTRERRPDLPASKPSYREIQVGDVNPEDPNQILMPKLDGAHAIIDLKAGRSPRVYSYREAKRAPTGLIEHTHKMPGLLEKKVPKSLDGTALRAEVLAVGKDGKALPAQLIGGLLNSGVWKSRAAQEEAGVRLKVFPFSVVRHKGRDMENAPFSEKLKVLREAERSLRDVEVPEIAEYPEDKANLIASIADGSHPLTEEGVVAVDKTQHRYTKAKFTPDFDVYVRKVHPAISGKTGEPHDRAGAISYSWTPDGPIVGQLGGFKHTEAKDMLENSDKYVGRAAKVKAMKVFTDKDGTPGALFQPRFKEWHLDKGDIEKGAALSAFADELAAMQKEAAKQDELEKIASLLPEVRLRPHQESAVQFISDNKGRGLLAHDTGSGKTLSSLAAVEKLREEGKADKTLVALPASLITNFSQQGVQKFTDRTHGPVGSGADYQLISLEKFRKDPSAALDASGADSLVIDEIHRAKDPGSLSYRAYREAAPKVNNLIGLTGSFISNHPKELVPLMDIVHPGHALGSQPGFVKKHTKREMITSGGFLRKYRRQKVSLKNKPLLHSKVKGKMHYVRHDELGDLPALETEYVPVPMSPQQQKHYDFAMGSLSARDRRMIREGLPVSQREAMHILPRLLRARQASNSVGVHEKMSPQEAAEATPKLKRVLDDIQEHLKNTKDGQAVAYTNFVDGGAREVYEGLKARGVPTALYSGENKKERDQELESFKAGKKKAIVLTPAGGEGISLNNATFFAEVDRHYNPERNQQAIARGRRLGGLAHRPEGQRKLEVRRYYSTPKTSWLRRLLTGNEVGVDEWVGRVAVEKDILNEEMRKVVRNKS
jgi:superfamily II DNA or RNA helicase